MMLSLKKINFLVLTIISLAFLMTYSISCSAVLTVDTMYVPLQITPGTSIDYELRVYNEGEKEKRVLIRIKDCTRDLDGMYLLDDPGSLEQSLSPYIDVTPTTFNIPPGSSHLINIKVAIPDGISGPHWGVVVVESGDTVTVGGTENSDPSSSAVIEAELSSALGILVTQSDPAVTNNTGRINQIVVSRSIEPGKPGHMLGVIYENTGSTYQFGSGYFEVTSSEGVIVGHIEVDDFFVLPGDKYMMSAFLPEELKPGKYLILGVVDTGARDMVAGQQLLVVKEEE